MGKVLSLHGFIILSRHDSVSSEFRFDGNRFCTVFGGSALRFPLFSRVLVEMGTGPVHASIAALGLRAFRKWSAPVSGAASYGVPPVAICSHEVGNSGIAATGTVALRATPDQELRHGHGNRRRERLWNRTACHWLWGSLRLSTANEREALISETREFFWGEELVVVEDEHHITPNSMFGLKSSVKESIGQGELLHAASVVEFHGICQLKMIT